ncbi:recombinase family protein [Corynebacterium macginleyi]|uniref:Recombinase family protein n=1 Tax=Corynebacterium macginleyi TaxID=38290 RepID=A0A3M0GL99_9CORY|nr:recombinase family protein [Corynebacterium macginleyi]MBK4149501.1 recombinase family protein [Corynebacterium macginleyi]MBK4151221.1 recombinase family protein [Corynebacterium macginleyi]MBK4156264.1 recombinase family protein [Corynebacterium macginleyi]MBK4164441.1 recombinase family protein [Corynebacterium macginleyi]
MQLRACSKVALVQEGTDALNRKLVITLLAAVAEFERETIRQRQAEGIAPSRRRGDVQHIEDQSGAVGISSARYGSRCT